MVSDRLRGMIYMSKTTTISYTMIGSSVRRLQLNYNDSVLKDDLLWALKCLQICTNNCKDKFPFIGRNNEHVMYKLGAKCTHTHTHDAQTRFYNNAPVNEPFKWQHHFFFIIIGNLLFLKQRK